MVIENKRCRDTLLAFGQSVVDVITDFIKKEKCRCQGYRTGALTSFVLLTLIRAQMY